MVFPQNVRAADRSGAEVSFVVDRPERFGGLLEYASFEEAAAAFTSGDLHPKNFKGGVAGGVNEVLAEVRACFEKNPAPLEMMREVAVARFDPGALTAPATTVGLHP